MIYRIAAAGGPFTDWRQQLATAITDPSVLLQQLELPATLLAPARAAAQSFNLCVPQAWVALMERGNPADPLLRQVLPLADELCEMPGFTADPVGDQAAAPVPGLLAKYPGRALLLVSSACAIHCRYCFRRAIPATAYLPPATGIHAALEWLRAHPACHEIILSGGDPLTLADDHLGALLNELAALPHLRRLRLHTRLPVVLPERITPQLLTLLDESRFKPVVVVQVNHPRELTTAARQALHALGRVATLFNQAVLLRGVNDDLETLQRLSEDLSEVGVIPYYLHLLDRTQGTTHFEVSAAHGRCLVAGLRHRLSGYLVPRLVREVVGALAKVPVA